MSELGKKLRKYRASKGLTRGQLAKEIGIPLPTLRSWELGLRKPSNAAERMIKAFLALMDNAERR